MSALFQHGYALLVGVGESTYSNWSLPVTVKDMQSLQLILTDVNLCAYPDNEEHMRLLSNDKATRQAILDSLSWLAAKAAVDSDATIIIYYSGHGWRDIATDSYYLLPHDVEPYDIPSSAISSKVFTNALRAISAKRLLVFIDSCHAAGMATSKDEPTLMLPPGFSQTALPKNTVVDLKHGEGRAVFSSSCEQQRSWVRPDGTMSIYTYHLLEALLGANSQPGDETVHISNLMNYLAKTVPESSQKMCNAEQTPFFDTASEDFSIAMLRGGKGLPPEGRDIVQSELTEKMQHIRIRITGDGQVTTGNQSPTQMIKVEGGSIKHITQVGNL